MTNEIKSDLERVLKQQYQHGYAAGYALGKDDGRALLGAARRDVVVVAFAMGALLGLVAGVSL